MRRARGAASWVAWATGSGLDDPPTDPVLDYEPVGSLAGTMRVKQGAVDFGASDGPMNPKDLAQAARNDASGDIAWAPGSEWDNQRERPVRQFCAVAGATAAKA